MEIDLYRFIHRLSQQYCIKFCADYFQDTLISSILQEETDTGTGQDILVLTRSLCCTAQNCLIVSATEPPHVSGRNVFWLNCTVPDTAMLVCHLLFTEMSLRQENTIERLASCETLPSLLEFLGELLQCPILLTSVTHKVLAFTASLNLLNSKWSEASCSAYFPLSSVSGVKWKDAAELSLQNKCEIPVESLNSEEPYLLRCITLDNNIVAHLCMIDFGCTNYSPTLVNLVERLIVSWLATQHDSLSKPSGLDATLIELLTNKSIPEEYAVELLKPYRWPTGKYLYVVSLSRESEIEPEPNYAVYIPLLRLMPNDRYVVHRNKIVLILSTDRLFLDITEENKALIEFIQNNSMFAGISRPVTSVHELAKAYSQSQFVLQFGMSNRKCGCLLDYKALWVYDLISSCPQERQRDLVAPILRPLYLYDKKHNSGLMNVLRTYLSCGCRLIETSKKLYMHRNTVKNKLDKCYMLTGIDPEKKTGALHLWLAILIYEKLDPSD